MGIYFVTQKIFLHILLERHVPRFVGAIKISNLYNRFQIFIGPNFFKMHFDRLVLGTLFGSVKISNLYIRFDDGPNILTQCHFDRHVVGR